MNGPFDTKFEELPDELPVFPIHGSLLLPEGRLPLEVFEQRYINLMLDCLGKGRLVGMIQPKETAADDPSQQLYNVGCVGRISSYRETSEGYLYITLSGVCRFKVKEEIGLHNGYRMIRADYSEYKNDMKPEKIDFDRERLLKAFERYTDFYNLHIRRKLVEKLPNSLLLLTLSMILPFKSSEKQALLECMTAEDRYDSLIAILEMGLVGIEAPMGKH